MKSLAVWSDDYLQVERALDAYRYWVNPVYEKDLTSRNDNILYYIFHISDPEDLLRFGIEYPNFYEQLGIREAW